MTIVNSAPGDEVVVVSSEPDLRVLNLDQNVLSSTALRLPAGVDLPQWMEIGRSLGSVSEATRWWVGDFLIYGEAMCGQDHTQIFDPEVGSAWSWDTLRQYRWVSERVPEENRRPPDQLSWSHHRAIAILEPHEQSEWLQRAIDERLSVRDLKKEIKKSLDSSDSENAVVPAEPFAEAVSLSSGRIGQPWDEEAHMMLCIYLGVT